MKLITGLLNVDVVVGPARPSVTFKPDLEMLNL